MAMDNASAYEEKRPIGISQIAVAESFKDVSSTFNDMHAERNYLVKRVFPQLSEWCAAHKLRLRDIDLRWGVTEKDSQENKRVVDVCLRNIDRCRPLFLCFLGQRTSLGDGIAATVLAIQKYLRTVIGCDGLPAKRLRPCLRLQTENAVPADQQMVDIELPFPLLDG